jgi:hypothetical protein
MKCTLTKKSSSAKTATKASRGAAPPVNFNLQDNGDDTYTVFGVDAAGNQVDISTVATLAAVSDTPAVVTADAPVGMTGAFHAATPAPAINATATLTITATWTDGSVGPFVISQPLTIVAGPAAGVAIQLGTPTVH